MDSDTEIVKNTHLDYCLKKSEELQYETYQWLVDNNIIDMTYEEYKEQSKHAVFGIVGQVGPPAHLITKGSSIYLVES